MSTTALRIIELVKSLPQDEQAAICAALNRHTTANARSRPPLFERDPEGKYFNRDGIPNEDPVFQLLDEIETERHQMPGRPSPQID